jgi:hypothetical protein
LSFPAAFVVTFGAAATGFCAGFLAEGAGVFAAGLPAAFFATFGRGFFFAAGFAARLDGECFDFAETGFFFAGFFGADRAFDGLAERLGVRVLGAWRFAAGFARDFSGFALRVALALDLGLDFFTGLEAFLAMIVLLLRRARGRAHGLLVRIFPEMGAARENFKL